MITAFVITVENFGLIVREYDKTRYEHHYN